MSQISIRVKERIKEEILRILFENSPKPIYTNKLAEIVLRDDEFTLTLLTELEKQGFVKKVKKNKHGVDFTARKPWVLEPKIYIAYKKLA